MAHHADHILRCPDPCPDIQCVNAYDFTVTDWTDDTLDDVMVVNTPDERQLTRKELSDVIDKMSRDMAKGGVGYGSSVGIWCGNCMEMIPLVMAVWKLEAAIVMIGPSLTINEAKRQMQKVKVNFLFVDETRDANAKQNIYDPYRASTVFEINDKKLISMSPTISTAPSQTGKLDPYNDTAIVFFSSGTTGLPKPVQLTHANIDYYLHINGPKIMSRPMPPCIHFLPLTHFYGFGMILRCLCDCTPILLLPRFQLEEFIRLVAKYQVTVLFLVPPVAVMMTQRTDLMEKYDLSCVLGLFCAAAPISLSVTEKLAKMLPGLVFTRFKQGYGMTETTGGVTRSPVQLEEKDPVGSVGKVIPLHEIKIIDENTGKACGPTLNGEICVRGPLIMKGYYDDVKATKETIDQEGWVHTGDVGYYDNDGFVFIVDRAKELIKCRGNQVAPAELEDLLLSHDDVDDVAVVGLPDELAGELPLAFVVKKRYRNVTEKQLQDFVAERVAPYKKLAGGVRFTESIPKLATGKILRRQLRDIVRRQVASPSHKL